MRKSILFMLSMAVQTVLFAQGYFPEGTKWTEVRLDTLKYDSWYSKVSDEWMPNFETVEYYVKGEYVETGVDDGYTYRKVYTNGPEWTDSLTLLIREADDNIWVTVLVHDDSGSSRPLWPGEAYQFDWNAGKGLYFKDILLSNTTSIIQSYFYYGIIDEIKEGDFGGVRTLKYVDLDGKAPDNEPNSAISNIGTKGGRMIQGIGITEWNGSECLFGPPNPYKALTGELRPERQYRSMLIHFERDGEVLYDIQPKKEATIVKAVIKEESPTAHTIYDLQGRSLKGNLLKGLYIQNGRKVMLK